MSRSFGHFILLATVLGATGSVHAQSCSSTGTHFPNPPAAFTHTVVANGNWHQASVWSTGSVPGAGAIICIPPARSVTYRTHESDPANVIRFIQAEGELRIGIQNSARLYVDTLVVRASGSFMVGAPTHPVWSGQNVEVVFKPWNGLAADPAWDPKYESLGLISMGQVKLYGESKSSMVSMTRDALRTQNTLLLDSSPTNWQTGDRLVLPGSFFRQTTASTSSQDEVLTITAVTGNTVQFSPPLVHDHIRPGQFRLHVANLSRNLVLRSEPPALPNPERYRGHVMLMNANVELRNVALVDLGRTDKRIPLDDFEVTLYDDPPVATPPVYDDYSIIARPNAAINNRRGRYALHFHKNGISPGQPAPARVIGSVVEGAVGWGFVSHSSHVDFVGNIAYNFVGAGFVTEFGDELGTFEGNIAIRGIGDGIYDPVRISFANPLRPQPLADFAFRGDGFWFQGPAVRAINNVAAGCDGAGMIWHATGSPDVESTYATPNGRTHNRYSFFPGSALALVYPGLSGLQPRYWNFGAAGEKLVIADLPLLQNTGFEAYGNFVGHRLRFSNHDSIAWYGESPYRFDLDIHDPYADGRVEQTLEDQALWNNQYAFNLRYVSETLWKNTTAVNRLDHTVAAGSPPQYPYGAEFFLAVDDILFENLSIDGYDSAGVLDRGAPNTARSEISFTGSRNYQNFATFDSRFPVTCTVPAFHAYANAGPELREVVVHSHASHGRYLARYRKLGDQQWRMTSVPASADLTAIQLTKLQSGETYQVQVAAGCRDVTDYDQDGNVTEDSAPSLYFATQTFVH